MGDHHCVQPSTNWRLALYVYALLPNTSREAGWIKLTYLNELSNTLVLLPTCLWPAGWSPETLLDSETLAC